MNEQNLRPHPWKPGQSGNPKGRPKNRALEQLREIQSKARKVKYKELSKEDMAQWDGVLISCGADELKVIAQDNKTPVYAKAQAFALLFDMKNGRTKTLEAIYTRLFGKPKQTMELTGKDGAALMPERTLNKEQAAELYRQLEEQYKGKTSKGDDSGKE